MKPTIRVQREYEQANTNAIQCHQEVYSSGVVAGIAAHKSYAGKFEKKVIANATKPVHLVVS